MTSRAVSPPSSSELADPRVPLLRAQLLKAQQDALRWSEAAAQWKASAERRQAREQEQVAKCKELERQMEGLRKRHREDKEEWKRDLENKRTALISIMGMPETEEPTRSLE